MQDNVKARNSGAKKQTLENTRKRPITVTQRTVINAAGMGRTSPVAVKSNSQTTASQGKKEEKLPHREEKEGKKNTNIEQQRDFKSKTVTVSHTVKRTNTFKVTDVGKKGLSKARITAQKTLDAQNDSGASALSYGISGASGAVKLVNFSEKTSDALIKAAPHVAKVTKQGVTGIYQVGKSTVRVVRTIDSTIGMIKTGAIRLNKETLDRMRIMAAHKITNSRLAIRIGQGIDGIKTRVVQGVAAVKSGIHTTKRYAVKIGNGVVKTAVLAQGLLYGTVKINITKKTLINIAKKTLPVVGKGAKYTVKTGARVIYKGGKIVIPAGIKVGKGINAGMGMMGDVFANGGTFEAQAVGYGLKTAHYTVKGIGYTPKVARAGYRGVKTSVKTIYKGGRFVVKTGVNAYRSIKTGVEITKRVGIKQALKMYSKKWARSIKGKALNALRKAGNSIVNAAISLLKNLGAKVVLPLLVLVIIVVAISGTINAIAGSVSILFSPFSVNERRKQVDETEWLMDKIDTERDKLINRVKQLYTENSIDNNGSYHYIRFYNAIEDVELDLTDTNISNNIYGVEEYLQYIQPIFHTLLLSEYELDASERQMKGIFDKIWKDMTLINTEPMPTEYCNMTITNNDDGSYTVTPIEDLDGNVHADLNALSLCPNHSERKVHTGNEAFYTTDDGSLVTCDCDYYYWSCLGHPGSLVCDYRNSAEHVHSDECYGNVCGKQHTNPFAADFHIILPSCRGLICGYSYSHQHSAWSDKDHPGCYATRYCSTGEMASSCYNSVRNFKCTGYSICDGHKILKIEIDLNGLGELLNKYYLKDIKKLESKSRLTTEEQEQLNSLKEYYEICLQYINILAEEYGIGSTTVTSLDDVTLTPFTTAACSYIGKPFLRGGKDPNTGADSAGFVQYVYENYAAVSLPGKCRDQVTYGVDVDSIENAIPGDLIFWSNDGTDTGVYHVAIYLGNNLIVHASNSAAYPEGGIKASKLYGTIYKIKRVF